MSPSSTSSSDDSARPAADTAAAPDRAETSGGLSASGKKALLLCLGILLLLEFGAARRDWVWRLDPRRPVGILLAVEEEIIAPADDVHVVILGSSVMRDALLPRVFEEAAGLTPGTVLNLSLPNATPFDFVLMYERHREVFRDARLLFVGVEDWYFYEEPGVSERYHRWATLGERLTDYQGTERLPLLVSWGWQTYAARQAFAVDGLLAALRGERADVIGDDGRTRWRPEERQVGRESFDLASYEARLRERQWRDRQIGYLQELARLAGADALPVLFVRMPMRAAALEMRGRVDAEAESRLQEVLRGTVAAGETSRLLDLPSGESAGLEDRYFLDERHLGTAGAEIFSRYLGAWAASEQPIR